MKLGNYFKIIFIGLLIIFLLFSLTSLIFSLLLRFTDLNENSLEIPILITSYLAIFFGSLIAGTKGREKGWLIGLLVGLAYLFVLFAIQYLQFDQGLTSKQMIYQTSFIIVAICGGIFGVNLTSQKKEF